MWLSSHGQVGTSLRAGSPSGWAVRCQGAGLTLLPGAPPASGLQALPVASVPLCACSMTWAGSAPLLPQFPWVIRKGRSGCPRGEHWHRRSVSCAPGSARPGTSSPRGPELGLRAFGLGAPWGHWRTASVQMDGAGGWRVGLRPGTRGSTGLPGSCVTCSRMPGVCIRVCACGRVELCSWYRTSRLWGSDLASVGVWFLGCLNGASGPRGRAVSSPGAGVDVGPCAGVLCPEGSGWRGPWTGGGAFTRLARTHRSALDPQPLLGRPGVPAFVSEAASSVPGGLWPGGHKVAVRPARLLWGRGFRWGRRGPEPVGSSSGAHNRPGTPSRPSSLLLGLGQQPGVSAAALSLL